VSFERYTDKITAARFRRPPAPDNRATAHQRSCRDHRDSQPRPRVTPAQSCWGRRKACRRVGPGARGRAHPVHRIPQPLDPPRRARGAGL